jgi:hypothetical protein
MLAAGKFEIIDFTTLKEPLVACSCCSAHGGLPERAEKLVAISAKKLFPCRIQPG